MKKISTEDTWYLEIDDGLSANICVVREMNNEMQKDSILFKFVVFTKDSLFELEKEIINNKTYIIVYEDDQITKEQNEKLKKIGNELIDKLAKEEYGIDTKNDK